jgi:hypothetical protein
MKKETRFEIIQEENIGVGKGVSILRDKLTGIQYLFMKDNSDGYSGGLTLLLDKDGKPKIEERNE